MIMERDFISQKILNWQKEWSVCRPDESNGWVHKYELDTDGLKIFDFQKGKAYYAGLQN